MESALQARVVAVFYLVAGAVRQLLRDFAPFRSVLQEVCHDYEVLLLRESLLRARLELENVPVAALFVGPAREVLRDPGPLLASHGLRAHHKELVFLLRPADLALLLVALVRVVLALLLPVKSLDHHEGVVHRLTAVELEPVLLQDV